MQHMTNVSALPSDSLVKARTLCNMQAAFVQQALKYLQERLLRVNAAYSFSCFNVFFVDTRLLPRMI